MKTIAHGLTFAVRVELDVVADRVGGKETVDSAGGDRFLPDHPIQQGLAIREELAGLYAALAFVEDARVNTLEAPRVKKRRPVDELAQSRQRKIIEYANSRRLRNRYVFNPPFDRRTTRTRYFN